MTETPAGIDLVCGDLNAALDLFNGLGLRIDVVYPADDPHTAVVSGQGKIVRLTSQPDAAGPSSELPRFEPAFHISRAGGTGGEGRAGMRYRDLIPGRLGGRYIASHIFIPDGGPVADWVHYHRVAFQMIYVARGWVRVAYEDQGEPFVLEAGDMVIQPPGIRHRVFESAPGLEVVEIGCPALHETFADHDMVLPTKRIDTARMFGKQRFMRHIASQCPWTPWNGAEAQESAMHEVTQGLAEVRTIRRGASTDLSVPAHRGELMFAFILDGSARLGADALARGDSFVIPPDQPWALTNLSDDFRLLQVTTADPSHPAWPD